MGIIKVTVLLEKYRNVKVLMVQRELSLRIAYVGCWGWILIQLVTRDGTAHCALLAEDN